MMTGIPDRRIDCEFCSFFQRNSGFDKEGKWHEFSYCSWFGGELAIIGKKGEEFPHVARRQERCVKEYPHGADIQLITRGKETSNEATKEV
jgi:hypothetical protein